MHAPPASPKPSWWCDLSLCFPRWHDQPPSLPLHPPPPHPLPASTQGREPRRAAAVRRRDQRVPHDAPRHGHAPLRPAPGQPPPHHRRPAVHPRLGHDAAGAPSEGPLQYTYALLEYGSGFRTVVYPLPPSLFCSPVLQVPSDLQYALLEFIAHINTEDYDAIPQDFINLGNLPRAQAHTSRTRRHARPRVLSLIRSPARFLCGAQASRPRASRPSASRPPASPTASPSPSARSRRAEAPPRSASASRPSSRRAPLSSPFLVVYPLPLWASCTACLLPAARIPHCGVTPPTALQERYGAELSDRELEVAARDEMVSRMEAQLQVNHPPPSPLLTPASPDTRWCPCLSPAHSGVPPPPPHPSPLRGCRARASTSRASPTSWRRCRAATASCSSCRRTLLRPLSPPFASASHAARPSLPKRQPRPRSVPLPSSHEARTHPPPHALISSPSCVASCWLLSAGTCSTWRAPSRPSRASASPSTRTTPSSR